MGPRSGCYTMLRVQLLPLQERQRQLGPVETPPALTQPSPGVCKGGARLCAAAQQQSGHHRAQGTGRNPWRQRAEQPCGPTSPTRAAAGAAASRGTPGTPAAPRGRSLGAATPRSEDATRVPRPTHRKGDLAQLGHPLLALLLLGRQEVAAAAGLQAEGGGAGPGAALGGRGGHAGAVRQAHHRLVQAPRTQPPGRTRRLFAIEELQAGDAVLAGREQREPAPLPPLQGTESARGRPDPTRPDPTRPVPSRRGARPPPSLPLRPPEQSNLQPPSLGSARGTLGSAGLGLARSTPRPGDRPTPDLSQPRAEPTLVPNLLLCCTNSCPSLAGGSIPRRRSQRFRRRSRAEGRGGAGRARVGDAREGPRGAVRVDGAYRGVCVRACVGVCARVCACVCGRRLHHSLGSCATA